EPIADYAGDIHVAPSGAVDCPNDSNGWPIVFRAVMGVPAVPEIKDFTFRHGLGDASPVDVVDDCEDLRAVWSGINPQRVVAYPERLTVVRESLNPSSNVNTDAVAGSIEGRL